MHGRSRNLPSLRTGAAGDTSSPLGSPPPAQVSNSRYPASARAQTLDPSGTTDSISSSPSAMPMLKLGTPWTPPSSLNSTRGEAQTARLYSSSSSHLAPTANDHKSTLLQQQVSMHEEPSPRTVLVQHSPPPQLAGRTVIMSDSSPPTRYQARRPPDSFSPISDADSGDVGSYSLLLSSSNATVAAGSGGGADLSPAGKIARMVDFKGSYSAPVPLLGTEARMNEAATTYGGEAAVNSCDGLLANGYFNTSMGTTTAAGASVMDGLRCNLSRGPKQAADLDVSAAPPASARILRPSGAAGKAQEAHPARSEARQNQLTEVDYHLTVYAARHLPEAQRTAAYRKALDDVSRIYPGASPVLTQANRYLKELSGELAEASERSAAALAKQEKDLFAKFESFFEGKLISLIREKEKSESAARRLHEEAFALRTERDVDMMQLKTDLMKRLNECEKKEDEIESFRALIASVFQTNEGLTNRIEDLEELLRKHRIDIPPAPSHIYAYRSKCGREDNGQVAGGGSAGLASGKSMLGRDGVRLLGSQVSPQFIAASRAELDKSRLTLQKELLHNAFDDRTAYRMQVGNLRLENTELKFRLSVAEEKVAELNRYIYEKRFLGGYGGGAGADSDAPPLTPRPCDVPFAIQTELGVDLRNSTSDIVAELAAVATNLNHQLTSALLRLRQMSTVSEWMQEETLIELEEERCEVGVLPTFPVHTWPSIPHFLRTNVAPDVPNFRWSEAIAGAIFLEFFDKFKELRSRCRFIRDAKMVAPRKYQLFERREHVLVHLDATKKEVEDDEEAVPVGYVVSQFIYDYLMNLNSGAAKTRAALVLPGTLNPRFTVRGKQQPVELEFTRFAYNLWWCAQRYRQTQPLCRLFLDVLNGRLSIHVYDHMSRTMDFVRACIARLDSDRSHTLTYSKLVSGTLRIVHDLDSHAARRAILAIAQTFEENQVPVFGGRVRLAALVADEAHVLEEPTPGEITKSGHTAHNAANMPPRITAYYVPGRLTQRPGASVYMRYWRRLVMDRYERVYTIIEACLSPLVQESEVVLGLYLLPVPEALERVRKRDADPPVTPAIELKDHVSIDDIGLGPEDATLIDSIAVETHEELTSAIPTVTRNYRELLRERGAIAEAKREGKLMQMEFLVTAVLESIPRLSRSVHFSITQQHGAARAIDGTFDGDGSAAGGGAVGEGEGKVKPQLPLSVQSPRRVVGTTPAGFNASASTSNTASNAPKAEKKPIRRGSKRSKSRRLKVDGTAAGTGAVANSSGRKGNRKADSKEAIPMDMMIGTDKEMVEWFGFCAALRQQVVSFPERMFQSADDVSVSIMDIPATLDREARTAAAGAETAIPLGTPTMTTEIVTVFSKDEATEGVLTSVESGAFSIGADSAAVEISVPSY